jgi:hypothetical protein
MEITDRFAQGWEAWDARVRGGEDAAIFLRSAKDEELLELLAGCSDKDRKYERDVVTTEIQNRLARRAKEHPEGAEQVFRAAYAAYEASAKGQKAIHTAEGILKASGDMDLGVSVSASAIVSLDATKLAMEAAQAHVAELQAAQAQSRIAERLVEDAAQAALEVAAKTERGAGRVAELGHEAEARAAREAARLIREAAAEAARKLRAAKDAADGGGQARL